MSSDNNTVNNDDNIKYIRILTYNAFIRPPFVSTLDRDYRDERIKLIGENVFNDYDIIAFQEMFSYLSDRVEHVIEVAKEYGLCYYWKGRKNTLFDLKSDGGLLILSRYPIVEHDIHQLIRGIHGDYFSNKSVMYAKIEVLPNKYIHFFTTHVQASYSDYPHVDQSKSVRIRLTQLTEVRNFILEKTVNTDISEPIMLLGDLNVNSRVYEKESNISSKEYKIMIDVLKGKRSFHHPSVGCFEFGCGWTLDKCRIKRIKCYPDENDDHNDFFEVHDIVKYFMKCHPNTLCNIFSKSYYKNNDIPNVKKSLDYVFFFRKIQKSNESSSDQQLAPESNMIPKSMSQLIINKKHLLKKKSTRSLSALNDKYIPKERHIKDKSSDNSISLNSNDDNIL
ncbi:hypothetical protein LY90DRAFT_665786, partial [Neocallimastix californiae]